MKTLILFSMPLFALFVSSCGYTAERKVATPKGSVVGDMPWNTPGSGEGQGALGGSLSR